MLVPGTCYLVDRERKMKPFLSTEWGEQHADTIASCEWTDWLKAATRVKDACIISNPSYTPACGTPSVLSLNVLSMSMLVLIHDSNTWVCGIGMFVNKNPW